jgi:hypothetical protein
MAAQGGGQSSLRRCLFTWSLIWGSERGVSHWRGGSTVAHVKRGGAAVQGRSWRGYRGAPTWGGARGGDGWAEGWPEGRCLVDQRAAFGVGTMQGAEAGCE